MSVDWEQARAMKFATEPPPADWPADVVPISFKGAGLFGLHRRTHQLYFDGNELVTKRSLAWFERICLGFGAISAVILALVEIARAVGWITP